MGCGASSSKVGVAADSRSAGTGSNASFNMAVSPTAIPIMRGNTAQKCALHILFSKHDRRNANTLDAIDLASMLVHCGGADQLGQSSMSKATSSNDVKRIMKFIDEDGSGSIDRGEFLEWIESGINKPEAALDKFAAQGKTEALLVKFLRGVAAHVRGWVSSFEEIFASADGGALPELKIWDMMEACEEHSNSFSSQASLPSSSSRPAVCEAMCAADEYRNRGVVHRDNTIDFLVHVSLHGAYRKDTITKLQRRCYRMLISLVESNLRSAKSQARNVAGNPLIVLAASAMFSSFDASGDDVLDVAEIRRLLTSVCAKSSQGKPPSRESIQELMKIVDVDGDGMLSREEFVQTVLQILNGDGRIRTSKKSLAVRLLCDAVVKLAKELLERRNKLHKLHNRYAKQNPQGREPLIDFKGMSRLLRHCQRKQLDNESEQKPVKVTNSAVKAFIRSIESAAQASGASLPRDTDNNGVLVRAEAFSGPLLISSCTHPLQLQKQQLESREANLSLAMHSLVNEEVNRMLKDEKSGPRNRKRARSRSNSTTNDDDSSNSGSGDDEIREGETVDFGW